MTAPTLHLVQQSPFTHTALASCLQVCGPDDSIVLMHDAAYAALTERDWPTARVYALAEDIAERGLSSNMPGTIELIDYAALVALCSEHPHSLSWF